MSNKRKRELLDKKRALQRAKREAAQMQRLAAQGRIANGIVIPVGAIPADLSKQRQNNSYSPPLFYKDQPFQCRDCGKLEVWTATQQKWYFEVAKGPIYSQAVRCRNCRRKYRATSAQRGRRGDPHHYKYPQQLLNRVQEWAEPALIALGFRRDDRTRKKSSAAGQYIDYVRSKETLSIRWDRHDPRISAEFLDSDGGVRVIAVAEFGPPDTTETIDDKLRQVAVSVEMFAASLRQ